ncbi:UDP-glycosyltransferase 90A1-like [Panicum miliaceum]|uniref:UDP-glycosyltransferase 90A1-like n=1 Tax=Panicum miliaceum TaxID=4540 RepID=A0A3L6RY03_PANMI|nr:UDP-glycosyltransferase 90A1-like [Panicum miliaceum]
MSMPMASSSPSPVLRHVAMLPFMAKGHAIPLLHLTRVLLRRGLASAVTFLATPRDAPFVGAGAPGAAVVELPFPSSTAGPQSMDELPPGSSFLDVVSAAAALEPVFADALAKLDPRPDLLVHDGFLAWAKDAADDLGVPRLVSLGMGAAPTASSLASAASAPRRREGLRLTKADLAPPFFDPDPAGPHWDFICESSRAMGSSRGSILNSFHELESFYIDKWNRETPLNKMWPEPFQGRFRDRGKVVQGFINKLGILTNEAIKGFFSHCGWNSVMESISMGVPILTYPIAAEQKLNAKFVVDVLEVGIRIWPSKSS